ncbi:hypothetical protein TcasGA2_TC000428 [Tribolium castaneum]|uniref:Uncharacterized protein n=1 Tax=Tribolium castaneum TaxID=7070 RepID=D6WAC7_TRICA|nr:hypothetical protein TcasGA2_TC000428 [Tribolium castaneum]
MSHCTRSHAMNRTHCLLNGAREKSADLTVAWWNETVSRSADDDTAGFAVVWGRRGEHYGARILPGVSRCLQRGVQTATESAQRLEISEELGSDDGQEAERHYDGLRTKV